MSESTAPAIKTENLTKIYRRRHIALNSVSLEIDEGTVLGVLGPNGAGKTTLVKLLIGLQMPTAGKAYVLGRRMGPNAGLLRQQVGYVPAQLRFPERMTPIDYLDFVGRLCGIGRNDRRARLAFLLRATDLASESSQTIRVLSTGMRTRLAIAASLIHDPKVLVWDEPSCGLDPEARQSMVELTEKLSESKTIVLCSHYVSDVQMLCNRALVLDRGQVVFDGEPTGLTGGSLPSFVEIEIRGEKKEIAEAVKSISAFEELASCKLSKTLLSLQIDASASHATALANVLVTLADHGIEMTDLRVQGGAAEGPIASLLKEDKSRGFSRAYRSAEAA